MTNDTTKPHLDRCGCHASVDLSQETGGHSSWYDRPPAAEGSMRAIVMERHGKPEVLHAQCLPIPTPKRGEVRVKVQTIGINLPEVLSRQGVYGWAPKLPYVPGMEACGIIDAVGSGVSPGRVGERVVVGAKFGAYAEYVCVPDRQALVPPRDYSDVEAAAFLVNYLTAWIGLMEMARSRPTDCVLVTSAAGGVGSAAVQLAKAHGCRVVGLAGTAKQKTVLALGADAVVDYREAGWPAKLAETAGHSGFDVIFELVGGKTYNECRRYVAPMGRVVVAGISGVKINKRNPLALLFALRRLPKPELRDMLMRSYGIMSFHIGRLFVEQGVGEKVWRELVAFVERHTITPLIDQIFPFDQIIEAHRRLESRQSAGKVVIRL